MLKMILMTLMMSTAVIPKSETEIFIDAISKNSPRTKIRAQKILPHIYELSEQYNEDPLLITIIAFRESSFKRKVIGSSHGEIGIMQVHGKAAKGCNLKTARGQIECGIKWVGKCREMCDGTLLQTNQAYCTGRCGPPYTDCARKRTAQYNRFKKPLKP